MRRIRSLLFLMCMVFGLVATLCLMHPHLIIAQGGSAKIFNFHDIRFDESMGEKKPTPTIPKSWRFVGVSNGEKVNSNNLWFQDASGNIYMLCGFTDYGKFVLSENVQKINVGQ